MRVKGTTLRTRMEFLRERFGSEAPGQVLRALVEEDRRRIQSTLPGSWVPFELITRYDEQIRRQFGRGGMAVFTDIGAFSAERSLSSVYRMFVEQAHGDPELLLDSLASLHGNLYDWGSMRAVAAGAACARLEVDYEQAATRSNCLNALGFHRKALSQLDVGAEVSELACQASGEPLCLYEVRWDSERQK